MAPQRDSDAAFGRFVGRKYLALVGPEDTLLGSGSGDYIESHDLVVRVDRGHLISPEMVPDVGDRTDILFHDLRFGHLPSGERERFAADIGADITWICGAYPLLDLDHPHARDAIAFETVLDTERAFRTVRLDRYLALFRRVLTRPSIALSAINDLLGFDIGGLYVTGFSFAAEIPTPGHRSAGAGPVAIDLERESQRLYLATIAAAEPRISFDSVIAEELAAPAGQ